MSVWTDYISADGIQGSVYTSYICHIQADINNKNRALIFLENEAEPICVQGSLSEWREIVKNPRKKAVKKKAEITAIKPV